MRRIAAVTFARSEYSTFVPVLRALRAEKDVELQLIVSGMHLCPQFGLTVEAIEKDGFPITERVAMPFASDSPADTVAALGSATTGFAAALQRLKPDLVLLVGDRFELLSIAGAALAFRIPVAHISGGDVSEGAIDNQVRYAVTQMSHLHFVAMQEHAERLIRMGEEPWRVTVSGDPALDLLRQMKLLSRQELELSLGMELKPPVLLVTYHPTTLAEASATAEINAVIAALENTAATLVVNSPNADVGHQAIAERLNAFVQRHPSAKLFPNLGQVRYYSLLALADALVGNSSSGFWEAPSFELPAVNIGGRQRGRQRACNVIDAPAEAGAVSAAIAQALSARFRASLKGLRNPYGDGYSAPRIVEKLKQVQLGLPLLRKRFCESTQPQTIQRRNKTATG